jgi:hypothetical protein
VGLGFAAVATVEDQHRVVPEFLETEERAVAQFAAGFVWGKFRRDGWSWVDEIAMSTWTEPQIAQFFAYLPFVPETWQRVGRILGEHGSAYWTRTNANPYDAQDGLAIAIDALIKHGRPHAAIRCLRKMRYDRQPIESSQVAAALLAALHSSEPHAADAHEIAALIKLLQDDPRADPDILFRIEWSYLSILDQYTKAAPRLLERRLAEEPGFFCEVLRLLFRGADAQADQEPTEEMKAIAKNGYRLLSRWKTPPGSGRDGTFDGTAFTSWLEAVKEECGATGHLDSALMMIGHVLVYAPSDPDGLWIHRAAAAALNAKEAPGMRDGFRTELFNARGVHGFTAGQEELKLAAQYRSRAEKVEEAGFPRLASALRDLATSYEDDARRDSSRDPFDC